MDAQSLRNLRNRLLNLAWLAGLMIAASATAQTWQPLEADKAKLALTPPGLEAVRGAYASVLVGITYFETGLWERSSDSYPKARIIGAFLSSGHHSFSDKNESTLSEFIMESFSDARIGTFSVGKSKNKISKLEYQQFKLGSDTACVYVVQYAGARGDILQNDSKALGDTRLKAWYCDQPSNGLDQTTITQFLQSFELKTQRSKADPDVIPCSKSPGECAKEGKEGISTY